MTEVWIVGRIEVDENNVLTQWQVQGAFETEKEAVAACRDRSYFVGKLAVGVSLPHELQPKWPGAYYPLAKDAANRVPPR